MQLTARRAAGGGKASLLLLSLSLLIPRPSRAVEAEAAQRVTLFQEPSSSNSGITVIHPQTDLGVTLGSALKLAGGYSVDIVSGATPKVFGCNGAACSDAITGATKFSDTRHEGRASLTYIRPTAEVTGAYSYGRESDYRSQTATVSTRTDVLDHMFTLGFSYTHNFDKVCDNDNRAAAGQPLNRLPLASSEGCFTGRPPSMSPDALPPVSHPLHIDTFEPSVTWAATPRLLVQGGGTIQILDGFQANPYRSVALGNIGQTPPQESLPTFRQRFAAFGHVALAFPRTRSALHLMGRAYRDTWAVEAVTGEVNINQYLARFLLLSVRGRLHAQRAASFYRDANGYRLLGPRGQYWTGDRELSGMRNYLVGGKLAYLRVPEDQGSSFIHQLELAAKWEGLFYRLDSPLAPNADRKLALIWQLALSAQF